MGRVCSTVFGYLKQRPPPTPPPHTQEAVSEMRLEGKQHCNVINTNVTHGVRIRSSVTQIRKDIINIYIYI